MSKIFVKAISLVTALAGAAVFSFGCGQPPVPQTPVAKMDYAIERSIDSFERAEIPALIDRVTNGGSIEFKMDMSKLMAQSTGRSGDMDMAAKLFFRNGGSELALRLDALMNGRSILDGLAYTNGQYLALTSGTLLNNKAYGINFTNISEAFNNSMFAGGGMLGVGLPDEVSAVFDMVDALGDVRELGKRLDNLLDRMENDIFAILEKHADHSTVSGSLTVAGTLVATDNVTLTYDSDAIFNVVKDLLILFNNNNEFKNIFSECAGLASIFVDELEYFSTEDMGSLILMAFDRVVQEIDQYSSAFDGLGITVTSYISKSSNELVGAAIDIKTSDGNAAAIDVVCGPTMNDLREFTVAVTAKNSSGESLGTSKISFNADMDASGNYNGILSVSSPYEAYDIATVSYNRNSGAYDIALLIDGDRAGARGTYRNDGNTASVTLTDVYYGNESIDVGEISLTIRSYDNMPTIGNYIDILNMNQNQLQELAMTIYGNAGSLSGMFG